MSQNEIATLSTDFDDLPLQVVERILTYLPEWELAKISLTNKTVFHLANLIIRNKFLRLQSEVSEELNRMHKEICECPLTISGVFTRVSLFRSYSALEFLKSEMNTIKAIGRGLLYSEDKAFNFGRLLQEYVTLFQKALQRQLPPWQVNDWLTLNIWKLARLFMTEKQLYLTGPNEFFGTKVIDLVDAIISKDYSVSLQYKVFRTHEIVTIDALFCMTPQYVTRPPNFENIEATNENIVPNDHQIKIILEYLLNIAKVNNRIVLREEQYNRELELNNRRSEADENAMNQLAALRWVNQPPRFYEPRVPEDVKISGDYPYTVTMKIESSEFSVRQVRQHKVFRISSAA